MIEYSRVMMNSPTVKGVTIHQVKIVEPILSASGKYRDYVIVPLMILMESGETKIKASGFQLAVRDINTDKWWFVDGESLDDEVMNYFFPDFPSTIKLPELKKELF